MKKIDNFILDININESMIQEQKEELKEELKIKIVQLLSTFPAKRKRFISIKKMFKNQEKIIIDDGRKQNYEQFIKGMGYTTESVENLIKTRLNNDLSFSDFKRSKKLQSFYFYEVKKLFKNNKVFICYRKNVSDLFHLSGKRKD